MSIRNKIFTVASLLGLGLGAYLGFRDSDPLFVDSEVPKIERINESSEGLRAISQPYSPIEQRPMSRPVKFIDQKPTTAKLEDMLTQGENEFYTDVWGVYFSDSRFDVYRVDTRKQFFADLYPFLGKHKVKDALQIIKEGKLKNNSAYVLADLDGLKQELVHLDAESTLEDYASNKRIIPIESENKSSDPEKLKKYADDVQYFKDLKYDSVLRGIWEKNTNSSFLLAYLQGLKQGNQLGRGPLTMEPLERRLESLMKVHQANGRGSYNPSIIKGIISYSLQYISNPQDADSLENVKRLIKGNEVDPVGDTISYMAKKGDKGKGLSQLFALYSLK